MSPKRVRDLMAEAKEPPAALFDDLHDVTPRQKAQKARDGIGGTDAPKSRVEKITALAPFEPIDPANPYPRPWYHWWDAPVWRISSKNRTVVCSTSDEAVAKWIVDQGNKGLKP